MKVEEPKKGIFKESFRLLDLPGLSPDGVVSHYLSRKILKENKNRIPLSAIVSTTLRFLLASIKRLRCEMEDIILYDN